MTVDKLPLRHIQAECFKQDCGGTCPACTIGICKVCGGMEGSLTTHCPGYRMTEEEEDKVYKQGWDFINNKWIKAHEGFNCFNTSPKFR